MTAGAGYGSDPTLFEVPEGFWKRRRCAVCNGALSVEHTHTYVVQRQVWVKIGATNKPRRRINELARPAWTKHLISSRGMDWRLPLFTLAVIEGDVEHELHARFAEYHAAGEWFWDSLPLRQWVREVRR